MNCIKFAEIATDLTNSAGKEMKQKARASEELLTSGFIRTENKQAKQKESNNETINEDIKMLEDFQSNRNSQLPKNYTKKHKERQNWSTGRIIPKLDCQVKNHSVNFNKEAPQ